jgi:putative glutamine amidotransferase
VVTAWAPDGIIEAVESPDRRYVVAVQCHPEELWRKHEWARRLFKSFVHAAAESRVSAHRPYGQARSSSSRSRAVGA